MWAVETEHAEGHKKAERHDCTQGAHAQCFKLTLKDWAAAEAKPKTVVHTTLKAKAVRRPKPSLMQPHSGPPTHMPACDRVFAQV